MKPPKKPEQATAGAVSQPQMAASYQHQQLMPPPYPFGTEPAVLESQPQLYQEDPKNLAPPLMQIPQAVTPTVSSVSITRRDPRMARHGSGVTVTHTSPEKPASTAAEALPLPLIAPLDAGAKASSLPMPPAPPPSLILAKPSKTRYFG